MAHYIKDNNLIESLFHEDSFDIIVSYYLSLDPSLDISKFGLEVNDSGFTRPLRSIARCAWTLKYNNSNYIFLYSHYEICVNPFYVYDDKNNYRLITDEFLDMFYNLPNDILSYEREKKLNCLLK